MMKAGGTATIYFDDVTINGEQQDFDSDPNWVASGNRVKFEDRELTGAHNFGFSETEFAGGKAGEVGGGLWRDGDYAYYADRVGPLSLEQRLEARGRVKMLVAGPDSDMYLGWFNSSERPDAKGASKNYLAIHVGGPTRVGHYFAPELATSKGLTAKRETAPLLTPGKEFDWSMIYDPGAADGLGTIVVTLGKETVTFPLKPGDKSDGATFDRFGLFTSTRGGQMVKIYLDDLQYTAK
jgi:hypothetical protein